MSHAARVEIVTRAERRRWGSEEKLRIVQETLVAGASVSVVARRHGIASNLLYMWRRRALAGAMAGFAPVKVMDQALLPASGSARAKDAIDGMLPKTPDESRRGGIEVVLMNGCRVRVGADADIGTLRLVFEALGVR